MSKMTVLYSGWDADRSVFPFCRYYRGFFETPLAESRGDGVSQTLKLGALAVGVAGILILAFLGANGLL